MHTTCQQEHNELVLFIIKIKFSSYHYLIRREFIHLQRRIQALTLNRLNAPHEVPSSQIPVGLHDLCRRVREPQLSFTDISSSVLLFFVLMMHTRPSAVQVDPKIILDMSPIQQQFRLIFPQHVLSDVTFLSRTKPDRTI
jgi:hypothetical protein